MSAARRLEAWRALAMRKVAKMLMMTAAPLPPALSSMRAMLAEKVKGEAADYASDADADVGALYRRR